MGFLRVVELFPPLFPSSERGSERVGVGETLDRFFAEARSVRGLADVMLVADVKSPKFVEFSTLEAAALLKERLQVDAAPVIVTRDLSRRKFLSTVLTGLSLGLGHMMLAWGDDYPAESRSSNVRDYASLAESIREAALLKRRLRAHARFLAPVNVDTLTTPRGAALAKERLRAGAEYLLAQPPTTDLEVLERHAGVLRRTGLEAKVILNVFPFRDLKDVLECEKYFGWELPATLRRTAEKGGGALFEAEKGVVEGLRSRGLPGVYLNTRGIPGMAERLLS